MSTSVMVMCLLQFLLNISLIAVTAHCSLCLLIFCLCVINEQSKEGQQHHQRLRPVSVCDDSLLLHPSLIRHLHCERERGEG